MILRFKSHILLSSIFFILTLGQQYGFYLFKNIPIIPFSLEKYLSIFLMFFALSFCRGKIFRFLALSSVMMLNFFQMAHLSFFGTQVLPAEIYLLFTQIHEINGTLKEEFFHILAPIMFTVIPVLMGWWSQKKLIQHQGSKIINMLLCFWLIYNPARTYLTGNTWGRQPSTRELTGMNIYLATSYFLGKILPKKLDGKIAVIQNSSSRLVLTKEKTKEWDKIIVVLGESLTPHHMQIFGYPKETTPYLYSKMGSPNFIQQIGLSGGVSTDISVAFFLNLGFGTAGGLKAATGEHCLFKLAKSQNYKTHFLSIQSSEQVRYIAPYLCSSFLDDYRSLENIAPKILDHQAASDRDLLRPLKDILNSPENNFVILHQRGSHSPWGLRFSEEANVFKAEGKDQRVAHYDNSVREFDIFWKELDQMIQESSQNILVIYLSDHGESLGENKRWGHGFIEPSSFEIPILISSHGKNLSLNLPKFMTHYQLGLLIAHELGFLANQSYLEKPSDYMIYGNDIDGLAGKAVIKFKDETEYSFTYSAD